MCVGDFMRSFELVSYMNVLLAALLLCMRRSDVDVLDACAIVFVRSRIEFTIFFYINAAQWMTRSCTLLAADGD